MFIIIYTYIIVPNKIPEFFFTMMSQKIETMHFIINSNSNTPPKYISIPSQIVIFFISISTLVNKDTGLCINPLNHFFFRSQMISLLANKRNMRCFYKHLTAHQLEFIPISSIHLQTIKIYYVFNSIFSTAHVNIL